MTGAEMNSTRTPSRNTAASTWMQPDRKANRMAYWAPPERAYEYLETGNQWK